MTKRNEDREPSTPAEPAAAPPGKTVDESRVVMARTMQPPDANSWGNVHGGAIMRLVDEAGGAAAIRHSRARCVTVAMDSMVFKEPVYIGDLLTIRACLTYTGRTSMEVEALIEAEDLRTGEVRNAGASHLVYVAIDDLGRPALVAPLRSGELCAPTRSLTEQPYLNRRAPVDVEEARMTPPAQEPQRSTHLPTGVARPEDAARVLERVETRGIRFINLEFTDVVGMAKSVTIPSGQLRDTLARGHWFDGSAIEGLARVAETDMYLRPDLTTFAEIPWQAANATGSERVARLICDVLMPNGERFGGDPRAMLIEAAREAEAQGYRYEVSPELEFFLLQEEGSRAGQPLAHDRGGYFDLSTDLAADVRREIVAALNEMGVSIESSHHEVSAGQHEIDFTLADVVRVADGVVTARYAIKAIAQRHGLGATFMPKPFYGVNGNGMHTHQRLTRLADGTNAFADFSDAGYGLSGVGRRFIAGQLAHARGMCAILAPLVNSYKRLVPGFEAPVMVSWGRVNREALIRVPRFEPGAPESLLVELRAPDPSCNPYLAFAAMLRAGMDGVTRDLALAQPVEEGLYTLDETSRLRRGIALLPSSLSEALTDLQDDETMVAALGEQIAAWFIEAKSDEWEAYRQQVHPWELERYLPIF